MLVTQNSDDDGLKGDISAIACTRGEDEEYHLFAGFDTGLLAVYNKNLGLERSWTAHKNFGVDALAVGEDKDGTVMLYSGSCWGDITQWWPGAFELVYQNSTTAPSRTMDSLTSAGGSFETNIKQLVWKQGFLYSGDDGGKLCKWGSDLALHWCKDSFSDISSLAVFQADGREQCCFASAIQSQIIVGDLTSSKNNESSLAVNTILTGLAPLCVNGMGTVLCCRTSEDNSILIYTRDKSWNLNHKLVGHTDQVTGLAMHPSQPILASVSWDGTVKIWSVREMKLLQDIKCCDYLNCVSWANKGELFVGGEKGKLFKIAYS